MTETTLDKATLAALDLYEGERVLWAKVQDGVARGKMPEKRWNKRLSVNVIIMIVLCVTYFSRGTPNIFRDAAIGLSVFAILYVLVRFGPFKGLGKALERAEIPTFMSCVVTDRRVLLFNQAGGRVRWLVRSRMGKVRRDFAEGAPALVFTSYHPRKDYAFISADDFSPALRALES